MDTEIETLHSMIADLARTKHPEDAKAANREARYILEALTARFEERKTHDRTPDAPSVPSGVQRAEEPLPSLAYGKQVGADVVLAGGAVARVKRSFETWKRGRAEIALVVELAPGKISTVFAKDVQALG